jgi:hypothetical protein
LYGDDVDLSYAGFTEPQGSNVHHHSGVEDQTSGFASKEEASKFKRI